MKRWGLQGLCFALSLMAAVLAHADVAVPPLERQVTDLTGTLTAAQVAALEQPLAALEQRKGSQVAILIVPSTQPETIEQYSIRVVDQWKLGRKKIDDGVLLLVAKNDHKVRIEVGYGLEGVVNDATAKRIVDEVIVPAFKKGDFQGGLAAGAERIVALIDGEALPEPQAKTSTDWESALWFGFILIFIVGGVLRAMFGQVIGSAVVGVIAGAVAWMLSGLFIALLVGVIAFLFTLLWGGVNRWGGYSGGGWSSGGGGFDSGGGFSGGGGGFGGGGASGQW